MIPAMTTTTRAQPRQLDDISAARQRLRRHPAMIAATPLVPSSPVAESEGLLRLVALESLVERLSASNARLEAMIAHHKATGTWAADPGEPGEEEPAEEPAPEAPAEPPAEEPAAPEIPAETAKSAG